MTDWTLTKISYPKVGCRSNQSSHEKITDNKIGMALFSGDVARDGGPMDVPVRGKGARQKQRQENIIKETKRALFFATRFRDIADCMRTRRTK